MKKFFDGLLQAAYLKPRPKQEGPVYADMLSRSLASGLDLWVLYMVFMPVFSHIGRAFYRQADMEAVERMNEASTVHEALNVFWGTQLSTIWLTNSGVQLLILAITVLAMQLRWGNTPGKWIMGLKVVRRHSFEPATNKQYVLRMLGYVASLPPLMLGVLWGSFNRERRTWHDMIAGTVVLQTRTASWYWAKAKEYYASWRTRRSARETENDAMPPEA